MLSRLRLAERALPWFSPTICRIYCCTRLESAGLFMNPKPGPQIQTLSRGEIFRLEHPLGICSFVLAGIVAGACLPSRLEARGQHGCLVIRVSVPQYSFKQRDEMQAVAARPWPHRRVNHPVYRYWSCVDMLPRTSLDSLFQKNGGRNYQTPHRLKGGQWHRPSPSTRQVLHHLTAGQTRVKHGRNLGRFLQIGRSPRATRR